MSVREFFELPEDGGRSELIDGALIVNASRTPRHQLIVSNVGFPIRAHCERQGGTVFVVPVDVVLGDDVVVPDVTLISAARKSIIGARYVDGAPNLVIEVLSDGTRRRDEIDKRKLYERAGVDEYWIVDPEIDLVKIYRREGEAFVRVGEVSAETGGTITSPLLPGFSLDVRAVFPQ